MQKLTERDITNIIGTYNDGYKITQARVKGGKFSDSDNYGIVLGVNDLDLYVTWQFHLENETPSYYWGHYHMEDAHGAKGDYETRE